MEGSRDKDSKFQSDLIGIVHPEEERDENIFKCRSCGNENKFEDIIEKALNQFFRWQDYDVIKEGGEYSSIQCPRCFKETYVVNERKCAFCLEELEHRCKRCGMEIPLEELFIDTGYCGWCEHMMNKDD